MTVVNMPDGVPVSFPDDMPPEQIRSLIERKFPDAVSGMPPPAARLTVTPNAPPAAAPPQEAYRSEHVPVPSPLRPGKLGVQGVGSGLAHVAGAPVDLMSGALNLGYGAVNYGSSFLPEGYQTNIPMVSKPFMGGDFIKEKSGQVANALGFGLETPQTPREKLAYNVDDFGTQAVTMAGPLMIQAGKRVAEIAGTSVPKFIDRFVRPYFTNAPRALTGDLASGIGAGAAVTAADELLPQQPNGRVAEVFTALAKGLAPMVGGVAGVTGAEVAGAAGRGTKNAFVNGRVDPNIPVDPKTLEPATRGQTTKAAQIFQDLAVNPTTAARTAAEKADELRTAGLPTPTIGLISGDVGLQSAETAARTKKGAPFVENDAKLRTAATDRVEGMRDPGADLTAVRPAAQAERTARIEPADLRVRRTEDISTALERVRQEQGAEFAPVANMDTKAQASRRLDTAVVDNTYLPDRQYKNALFENIDPQRTQMVDAQPVVAAARTVRQGINDLAPMGLQMPGEFVQRLAALEPQIVNGQNVGGPGNVAIGQLNELRPRLASAYEAAQKSKNFTLADNITVLRRAIDETIGQTPEAAPAGTFYREEFAPRYRAGPGDEGQTFTRAIDSDPRRTTTPPSETAGRFLSGPEKAQSLQRILEGAPSEAEGMTAVRQYMRSDFAMSTLNPDGTLNPNRAAAWARNNADVLAQFPQLRQEFEQIGATARRGENLSGQVQQELATARRARNATEQEVDRSIVGTLLREDPRDVAKRILDGGYGAERELAEIQRVVGQDPAAARGWKAAFSEVMADKVSGTAKIDAGTAATGQTYRTELGKLDKLFKENESLLAQVYSPEEMSRLRQAHSVLEPLKNASVRATAGSDTADKAAQVWRLAEAGLKAKYGILKGGGMLRTMRVMASTLPNDVASVQRLVERAWFNPGIAEYLLTQKVGNLDGPASNAWVRRAITGGELSRTTGEAQQEP